MMQVGRERERIYNKNRLKKKRELDERRKFFRVHYITGGPIESAIEIEDEAHDIKYPKDVETFATSETTPHAIAK